MGNPTELLYTKTHEWVRLEGGAAVVGLTDHAQRAMGDIVFVSLPAVGDTVAAGAALCDVESVKAVSEVYCPVDGVIAAVNEELASAPERINQSPYEAWIVKIDGASVREPLLTAQQYEALVAAEQ
jgi:glycine cleavage system H protein